MIVTEHLGSKEQVLRVLLSIMPGFPVFHALYDSGRLKKPALHKTGMYTNVHVLIYTHGERERERHREREREREGGREGERERETHRQTHEYMCVYIYI